MKVFDPHLPLFLWVSIFFTSPLYVLLFSELKVALVFPVWSTGTALNSTNHWHLCCVGTLWLQLPALHLDSALMYDVICKKEKNISKLNFLLFFSQFTLCVILFPRYSLCYVIFPVQFYIILCLDSILFCTRRFHCVSFHIVTHNGINAHDAVIQNIIKAPNVIISTWCKKNIST